MGQEGETELVVSDPKEQMDEIIVALNLDKVCSFLKLLFWSKT